MSEETSIRSTGPVIIIRPNTSWLRIDWQGLVQYRDLLFLFVRRDFLSRYKQTVLGPAWFIIQPLITTLVFSIIFGQVAKVPTDGIPPMLFYLCALVPWNYFQQNVNATSVTFTSNIGLLGKVYFPRLIIPVSAVLSNLIVFVIQFLTFIGFFVYFKYFSHAASLIHPGLTLFLMPLLLLQTAALSLGSGLLLTALTVKYRDLAVAMGFLIQLWMYATPIVYPMSAIPPKWRFLVAINPMSSVVESFKHAFLGIGTVGLPYTAISVAMTIIILLVGLMLFNRAERTFVDTV